MKYGASQAIAALVTYDQKVNYLIMICKNKANTEDKDWQLDVTLEKQRDPMKTQN